MKEFIKQTKKIDNLYISNETLNKIIEIFKKEIINNRETFLEIYKIDIKNCIQTANLNTMLDLLELYKKEKIESLNEKKIIIASYYGNPYITLNLCMQALIKKSAVIALIEDSMLGINKMLISIFNNILENFKIDKMIEIYNLVNKAEIQAIQNDVDKIICIGNTNKYNNYKKCGIQNLEYIPFSNMAIFCEDENLLQLQLELYNYCVANGIEVEVYADVNFEEFAECVREDKRLKNIVVFTNNEKTVIEAKKQIENIKLFVNKNPYKNETFKIDIV